MENLPAASYEELAEQILGYIDSMVNLDTLDWTDEIRQVSILIAEHLAAASPTPVRKKQSNDNS